MVEGIYSLNYFSRPKKQIKILKFPINYINPKIITNIYNSMCLIFNFKMKIIYIYLKIKNKILTKNNLKKL